MPIHSASKNTKKPLSAWFCLLFWWANCSLAQTSWQIVVLPDNAMVATNELPVTVTPHNTVSQGLAIALSNANFAVLNPEQLGLPNCQFENCSVLNEDALTQAFERSGKEANLAVYYGLTTFKQPHSLTQKWYFSLSGRLVDLQSGIQLDAFNVDNNVYVPAQTCIGDCFSQWAQDQLALLAQDLGAVLSEKLMVLPRRFEYQLKLHNFTSEQLQQIDQHLKTMQGYVSEQLLTDQLIANQPTDTPAIQRNTLRTYQYLTELTASELATEFEKINAQSSPSIAFEYYNNNHQFDIVIAKDTDSWATLSQFFADLFDRQIPENDEESVLNTNDENTSTMPETTEQVEAQRDLQVWQQAQEVNSVVSYQQYLKLFPEGLYFIQAQAKIQTFLDDQNHWQQALDANTTNAFQHYLSARPSGLYTHLAKQQLSALKTQQLRLAKQQENRALANNLYQQQQDYPKALYYYQQAADLGDSESQYRLAKMHEMGKGTTTNMQQAAHWFSQAASKGHSEAQATLGYLYSKGNGVKQDYAQAAQWYELAATQGNILAQHNLAYLYSRGQGLTQNHQRAAYWYNKSAEQGDADSQNSLAKLYERGLGVEQNLTKAKTLYQLAAAQGNQMAQLNLQMLNN